MRSSSWFGVVVLLGVAVVVSALPPDEGDRLPGEPGSKAPKMKVWGGYIEGVVKRSEKGRRYFAYMGVPYALSPAGENRFKFPRDFKEKQWKGVKKCVAPGPRCPQLTYPEREYIGEEDCLSLSVYTHRLPNTSVDVDVLVKRLRPVVVFLHGGGFQHGGGDFDGVGPERFMDNKEDVILVTVNYRLGPLGFLALGSNAVVGNAAMKDQHTALIWVHRHIADFGGMPHDVLLAGHEAGGIAAHLHAMSPLSSAEPNMFKRTLSMSGTALTPWGITSMHEARKRAWKLAELLECVPQGTKAPKYPSPDEDEKLAECLRSRPTKDIVTKAPQILEWRTDISYPFVPVVEVFDGHNRPFIVEHPLDVLEVKFGGLKKKTWLATFTKEEGLPLALQLMVFRGLMADLNTDFERYIFDFLGMSHIPDSKERREIGRALRDAYMSNEELSYGTLNNLIDLTTDAHFRFPALRIVEKLKAANVSHALLMRFSFDRHEGHALKTLGVPQGADVELMFPATFAGNKTKIEKSEKKVAEKLLKLLITYAKIGDPTPEPTEELDNASWPIATEGDLRFLDMDINGTLRVPEEEFMPPERVKLWKSITARLEKLQRDEEATSSSKPKTKTEKAKSSSKSKTKTEKAKSSEPKTKTEKAKSSEPKTKTEEAKSSEPKTKTEKAKSSEPKTKTKDEL